MKTKRVISKLRQFIGCVMLPALFVTACLLCYDSGLFAGIAAAAVVGLVGVALVYAGLTLADDYLNRRILSRYA